MSQQIRHIKDAKKRQERRHARYRIRRIRKMLRLLIPVFFCIFLCAGIFFGVQKIISLATAPKEVSSGKVKQKKKDTGETIDTSHVRVKNLVISTDTQKKSKKGVTVTVSSIGDCTLGTDENFDESRSLNAYYNEHGADYFFQNVRPVLEKDDLTVVNMEGTLTEETEREEKTYAFKAPPEYVSILTSGSVEAANLANNHSQDYGLQSYNDTISCLEDAGISPFGYENVAILETKGVKIGLAGIYELSEHLGCARQVKENVAALRQAGAQVIVVNFHWGTEREYSPDDVQKQLAHLAIDEGADLVIGHHPHVLQGIEKYKGRYIAYSLGNFCFGGNSNPEDKDTMIFQQTFTVMKDGVKKDDNINIIPCSLSSSGGHNDYCPMLLEGEEKDRVLKKIEDISSDISFTQETDTASQ